MRRMSPMSRRRLQKVVRHSAAAAPAGRVDSRSNPEAQHQYFQIIVNILEAKRLMWSNGNIYSKNSYVIVALGKQTFKTNIQRHTEEPCFREKFSFTMHGSLSDAKCARIWLGVMELRNYIGPKVLGETTIDVGAIWDLPNHHMSNKWVQLNQTRKMCIGPVGLLKVDIVMSCHQDHKEILWGNSKFMQPHEIYFCEPPALKPDTLTFQGSSFIEQHKACYQINVYSGFCIPNYFSSHDKKAIKSPSTFVRVLFSGLVAKTSIEHRTNSPEYNQQISMIELFPSLDQSIYFEVCSSEIKMRILASAKLDLARISHDGENGFVPTFGPSLLHMYGDSPHTRDSTHNVGDCEGPYYKGALLISLKTLTPYIEDGPRCSVQPLLPLRQDSLWEYQDFIIFCPILEVSMINRQIISSTCGVAVTMGDLQYKQLDSKETRKLHYTGLMEVKKSKTVPDYGHLDFTNSYRVLQLNRRLPDFRFRIYRSNMISKIVTNLQHTMNDVDNKLMQCDTSGKKANSDMFLRTLNQALDDLVDGIMKYIEVISASEDDPNNDNVRRVTTDLDNLELELQKEEMQKICQRASIMSKVEYVQDISKKSVKRRLFEMRSIAETLKSFISKAPHGWPDVVVWLLNEGSRVAYAKLAPEDILHSLTAEQCGSNCGNIQTIMLKPVQCPLHINCECHAARLEVIMWMGLADLRNTFDSYLPEGYNLVEYNNYILLKTPALLLECRIFVYKGKFNPNFDCPGLMNTFVRFHALNVVKDTQLKKGLNPVWDQVLKMDKVVSTTTDRLYKSPPHVLVEVHRNISGIKNTEVMGRLQLIPEVDIRQDYETAPKLQWKDVFNGSKHVGQLLISAQIIQIPEKILKSTVYTQSSVSDAFSQVAVRDTDVDDAVETVPYHLIPQPGTYKIDVYWWGLRHIYTCKKPCVSLEIDDLVLKSEIINEKRPNCNFTNGKISQVFQSTLGEMSSVPFIVKLYDTSTFGRTMLLGSKQVRNLGKYIVNWIPKCTREATLKSPSFDNPSFMKVNQYLYVRKSNETKEDDEHSDDQEDEQSYYSASPQPSKWKFLCKKDPPEEEHTLLPIYVKSSGLVHNATNKNVTEDWWSRFYEALNNAHDCSDKKTRVVIYQSELENQKEFSKFKDWCTSIKIYRGQKTGKQEKDDELFCGIVKAGIALYSWPPPDYTTVVGPAGNNLDESYFKEFPINNPVKFLVRVHIVRGIRLASKDGPDSINPYLIINCGNKHIGSRRSYLFKSSNPIFGRLYELRCTLPDDYLMTITLFDRGLDHADELIGCTIIDLEDRFYSKHRPLVGLATEYNSYGPNRWRDCIKPSKILEELCQKNHFPAPSYEKNSVILNGVQYKENDEDRKKVGEEIVENICLNILHQWQRMPICGYPLVPEHVETRSLYNSEIPDIEQGKLQMWIDMFPLDGCGMIPPPIDITPQKPKEYELRVVVWGVQGIRSVRNELINNADIFVEAWIGNRSLSQYTDVYENSKDGEAIFNWRMAFHFNYHHPEKKIIIPEKALLTENEERQPILNIQVLECDDVSSNRLIGCLNLNIIEIPEGVSDQEDCLLGDMSDWRKVNLFKTKQLEGWWPLSITNDHNGEQMPAGSIELELTLLQRGESAQHPAGLGRDPPCPLPKPQRDEQINVFGLFTQNNKNKKRVKKKKSMKSKKNKSSKKNQPLTTKKRCLISLPCAMIMFLILCIIAIRTQIPTIIIEKINGLIEKSNKHEEVYLKTYVVLF